MEETILVILVVGCVLTCLGVLVWLTRRSDSTVANRMSAPGRVDGTRDPRAYLHHSSY